MKHIHKQKNKYIITKRIKTKLFYFGTYNTLKDAIKTRDELIKNNWQKPKNKLKNINIRKIKNGENRYDIRKKQNGILKHFGTYTTLNNAIKTRNELIEHNWQWEEIICS